MIDGLKIEVVDEAAVSSTLDSEIKTFLVKAFSSDASAFIITRYWHGSAPAYSVLARVNEKLIAHSGAVVRHVRVGTRSVCIYGIQNMAVLPEGRGIGAGLRVLETVAQEARKRAISFGLLFCIPELERYYQRDGWKAHSVDVRMDYNGQVNIPIPEKNICMAKSLTSERFPEGDIHLLGADW